MQAQASSDTASPTPNVPSQKWLIIGIACGAILLYAGLVMVIYTLVVDVFHPHYRYIHEGHQYFRTNAVKQRGITWYFWALPSAAGFFMIVVFGSIQSERKSFWYREVPQGIIIDERDEPLFLNGYYFYFTIEGKNRAGKTVKQTRKVSQKMYFTKSIGDEVSFKKE